MIKKVERQDYLEASELIYDTSTSLSTFLFGGREKSIPKIQTLIAMGDNSFGHETIYGYYQEKELVGLYNGYTGEKKKRYDSVDLRAFARALGIVKAAELVAKSPILNRLLTSDVENDEFYLSNLIVNTAFRRRSIGRSLLQHAIETAKEKGSTAVILDVNTTNEGAITLYKKMGFIITKKKGIPFMNEATYTMRMEV
ncbi:MAG: GNAT family N-acetyltransferase [Euryarchaeota archaeon]|nr:GNAT family N-acetyltransferase [Euryarchaeota archaeon]